MNNVRFVCLALGVASLSGTGAASSEFIPIVGSVSDAEPSEACAVDSLGNVVVGTRYEAGVAQAFLWTPTLGAQSIEGMRHARGVSGDGDTVVGDGINSSTGIVEPVRWKSLDGGELLGGPTRASLNSFTSALDTSSDGSVIVGVTKVGSRLPAFRWTSSAGSHLLGFERPDDHSTATGVSDDGAVVVGEWQRTSMPSVGFRWTAGAGVTLLESPIPIFGSSRATDISPDGSVVVGEAVTEQAGLPLPVVPQAFRWSESTGMTFLQNTIGGGSTALGATQSGEAIVGTAGARAFVWTKLHGMERLDDVLADHHGLGSQLAGWTLY